MGGEIGHGVGRRGASTGDLLRDHARSESPVPLEAILHGDLRDPLGLQSIEGARGIDQASDDHRGRLPVARGIRREDVIHDLAAI